MIIYCSFGKQELIPARYYLTGSSVKIPLKSVVAVVLALSHARLCIPSVYSPLSSATSQNLLKFMFTELVILSNHLILYRPLRLWPSIFPIIRVFSNESALCIR